MDTNRFYLLLLNDPHGARPLGAYTKREARIAQIANVGSRIITAAQLATMRATLKKPKRKGGGASKLNYQAR